MQTVNLLTIELQLRVEGSNNLLSHFLKKSLKNLIFSLKPALKSSSDGRHWPGFLFFPVFHDLDLPPFQNNLRSTCSYFPEKPIDKKLKSIKIVSDQVILLIVNGKRWKAIQINHLVWIPGMPSTLEDVWNSGMEIFYLRLYFSWYLPARTVNVIKPNSFCHWFQKRHGF